MGLSGGSLDAAPSAEGQEARGAGDVAVSGAGGGVSVVLPEGSIRDGGVHPIARRRATQTARQSGVAKEASRRSGFLPAFPLNDVPCMCKPLKVP